MRQIYDEVAALFLAKQIIYLISPRRRQFNTIAAAPSCFELVMNMVMHS
jgi:hypothetical protein